MKLFRFRQNLKPELGVKNFLLKIATNLVNDFYRKKKREPILFSMEDDDLDKIEAETKTNPQTYSLLEAGDVILDIERALVEIKPEYRMVLLLFYYQGMAYQEIADMLNMTINTVKTYVHRGNLALKSKLIDQQKNSFLFNWIITTLKKWVTTCYPFKS
jgi:RNA polymerase sigma-70 factor (ECF subfamily)